MKYPRYVIDSVEIVTEFDDEDVFTNKIRAWSRLGYKTVGGVSIATCDFKDGRQSIIYSQLVARKKWLRL